MRNHVTFKKGMKTPLYTLCAGLLLFTACSQSNNTKSTENTTSTQTEQTMRPLEQDLNARKVQFSQVASADKKTKYAEGIEAVHESKVVEKALQVGDKAIDFTLTNAKNEQVSLAETLKNGPVILMWYRGGWCPYCNLTLRHMQASLPEFEKYGAQLLALTPELPDSSLSTQEKNHLDFEVLSDIDNAVAMQYNVVFQLTDDVAQLYEDGFGLSAYNGNKQAQLPLAATYVINQDGEITYAFLDADYRNRAEPADIVAALQKL